MKHLLLLVVFLPVCLWSQANVQNGSLSGTWQIPSSDTSAPTVSITSPTAGTVSGVVSVTVTAADNVGVTSVQLWQDGVLLGLTPSVAGSTYTFLWDSTQAANGSHTLQAKASDAALNLGTSTLVSVLTSNGDTGAPLIYSARTDSCVHGADSPYYDPTVELCTPNRTTGQSGSALLNQEGLNDPVPFTTLAAGAVVNASYIDPDFNSYAVFVTDQGTSVATANWNMGSTGDVDAFSIGTDKDVLLNFNNTGGSQRVVHVVRSRFLAHTCNLTSSKCIFMSDVVGASCTPSAASYTAPYCTHKQIPNGGFAFSRNAADYAVPGQHVYYESQLPQVYKVTFTSHLDINGFPDGVGDSVTRTIWVDFSNDSGGSIPCSVVAPDYVSNWQSSFVVSNNGTITLASSGGGSYQSIGTGTGGAQAIDSDTFINPTNHNTQMPITNATYAGGIITYSGTFSVTSSGHHVVVVNLKPAGYNGTFTTLTVSPTTITVSASDPGAASCTDCGGNLGYKNAMYQACNASTGSCTNGTTSGVEPDWMTLCQARGDTCTDGTVTWTNIGNVNGQDQGFDIFHFDPQRGCTYDNSRMSKTRRGKNEGLSWPNPGTPDPSGPWTTDVAVICYRMGGTNCGSGGVVNLEDKGVLHEAGQRMDSEFGGFSMNGGGINDNYKGSTTGDPTQSAVPNGSCTPPVPWTAYASWPQTAWVSLHSYTSGQYVSDPVDHNYYVAIHAVTSSTLPHSDAANWTFKGSNCYVYLRDYYSTMVRPFLEIGAGGGCTGVGCGGYGGDGHTVGIGYAYMAKGGPGFLHKYSQPNCNAVGTGVADGRPYYCPYIGSPYPGIEQLSTPLPADHHGSWRNTDLLDLRPTLIPTSAVPNWGSSLLPVCSGGNVTGCSFYSASCYNEICGVSSDGLQTLYRFAHGYNTGSSPLFQTQNGIGVVSPDGKMLAFTSDFMNTRGDTSGAATCINPVRAMYEPLKNGTVSLNDYILPIGNNSPQYIYKATACNGACKEGAVFPNWAAACGTVGSNCPLDGTVTWTNQGSNSCRSDIGLVDLTSARPTP